jgi:hypothetical protein
MKADLPLEKQLVKDTLMSLRNVNRKMLEANGIKEVVDDYVYLSIKMSQPIRPPAKLGDSFKFTKTPVQLALPFSLPVDNALLLVKKGNQLRI